MSERGDNFATRLDMALKALNISRVQLASSLGIDKSVISRWLSAQVIPSGHNLSRISDVFARAKPGFNAFLWERPLKEFSAFFDVAAVAPAPAADAEPRRTPIVLKSFAMSAREIATSGDVYVGLYVLLRQRFINNGAMVMDLLRVHRAGDGLAWELSDGGNRTHGTALLLRNKLHLVGEGESGRDGVTFHVLNGTGEARAMVMDGVLASVAGDRFLTPCAARVVVLRIADTLDDADADKARFDRLRLRINTINNAGESVRYVPQKFAAVVDNGRPFLRDDDPDWVMRVSEEETIAYSDWDAANYELPAPELAQAILEG